MNLFEAVITNDLKAAEFLLGAGADPNETLDETMLRPLHFAAQNNSPEMAKLLLASGADPHAKTFPDQETPLEIAHLHGSKSMVELLMEYPNREVE